MKEFTVVLVYPDYATRNYGQDCFITAQQGATVQEAVDRARKHCQECNDDIFEALEDLHALAVLPGNHEDLSHLAK